MQREVTASGLSIEQPVAANRYLRHFRLAASDHEKHFFTLDLSELERLPDALRLYHEVIEWLSHQGITLIYERVFGLLNARPDLLTGRQCLYRSRNAPEPPLTFIGISVATGKLAGAICTG